MGMAKRVGAQIFIRDLLARCIVGVNPEERREKQDVVINLTLTADLGAAVRSDRFQDTVDYRALKKRVFELVEGSEFFLLETLTDRVADLCLEDPRVEEVRVSVEKPSALRFARSVGVEIVKRRS
jgi:dihydroneopterin aldolase/D-erythro-7,8-dihydroneopterin triphosphate epimerase